MHSRIPVTYVPENKKSVLETIDENRNVARQISLGGEGPLDTGKPDKSQNLYHKSDTFPTWYIRVIEIFGAYEKASRLWKMLGNGIFGVRGSGSETIATKLRFQCGTTLLVVRTTTVAVRHIPGISKGSYWYVHAPWSKYQAPISRGSISEGNYPQALRLYDRWGGFSKLVILLQVGKKNAALTETSRYSTYLSGM